MSEIESTLKEYQIIVHTMKRQILLLKSKLYQNSKTPWQLDPYFAQFNIIDLKECIIAKDLEI